MCVDLEEEGTDLTALSQAVLPRYLLPEAARGRRQVHWLGRPSLVAPRLRGAFCHVQ